MKGKTFVDTNILVCAHDLDAGKKNEIAAKAISRLWESKLGVLSTQVLQELYVTLTTKIPQPLGRSTVGRLLKSYFSWHLVINDSEIILQAIEIEESHSISFWDALILSAAFSQNVTTILTQDLNHGQYFEGILIINPFI